MVSCNVNLENHWFQPIYQTWLNYYIFGIWYKVNLKFNESAQYNNEGERIHYLTLKTFFVSGFDGDFNRKMSLGFAKKTYFTHIKNVKLIF